MSELPGDAPQADGAEPDLAGAPRWVKVLGLVVLALVLAFLVLQLAGIGDHGPGRHHL
jgi:hypothetical protein